MKYIVMLGDGMADYPVPELEGKTPLEVANKPNMDYLAAHGAVGKCKTVPEGMPPGSDTANLSVMGYDPEVYYTGRSPLEAVSMGIDLKSDDIALRCNLVSLGGEGDYENLTMKDYSAGEISTAESTELINYLAEHLNTESIQLYPGISYRHCLVMNKAEIGTKLTPPHDITGKPVKEYLPDGRYGEILLDLMKRSRELLRDHPVNVKRREMGKNTADSCWFWGEGTRPALDSFEKLYGVKGSAISAVDLIKGIAICAGLKSVDVPGTTGNYDTNFVGKADAALKLLREGNDMVYIHVEAPDECGHHGDVKNKIYSIEMIDKEILGRVMEGLEADGEEYSILLAPDHPTPITKMTHVSDPVPFVLYRSDKELLPHAPSYNENEAEKTGLYIPKGCFMMKHLIKGEI